MSTIQPEGESVRRAVKWISDERAYDGTKPVQQLVEAAALKFNLSPKETAYLLRFFTK